MDFMENEAEVSSGSESETEQGRDKPTKKRAVIDSDDEEGEKLLNSMKFDCIADSLAKIVPL